jgi:hypothetical protein
MTSGDRVSFARIPRRPPPLGRLPCRLRDQGLTGPLNTFSDSRRNPKASGMPEARNSVNSLQNGRPVLLWDMAGTLIAWDPLAGRTGVLPGADTILPLLGKDFRMAVTTGDSTAGARELLRDHGLLDHFEQVFGGLGGPAGKPYGAVLAHLGGQPRRSLAVGDRLRADVAADTDEVVTMLINQDGDLVHAEAVRAAADRLAEAGEGDFTAGFDALLAGAERLPAAEGELAAGAVVHAARCDGRVPLDLRLYRHPALAGDRRIVII